MSHYWMSQNGGTYHRLYGTFTHISKIQESNNEEVNLKWTYVTDISSQSDMSNGSYSSVVHKVISRNWFYDFLKRMYVAKSVQA